VYIRDDAAKTMEELQEWVVGVHPRILEAAAYISVATGYPAPIDKTAWEGLTDGNKTTMVLDLPSEGMWATAEGDELVMKFYSFGGIHRMTLTLTPWGNTASEGHEPRPVDDARITAWHLIARGENPEDAFRRAKDSYGFSQLGVTAEEFEEEKQLAVTLLGQPTMRHLVTNPDQVYMYLGRKAVGHE